MTDQPNARNLNLTQAQLEELRRNLMHRFLVLTEEELDNGFDYTLRTIGEIAEVDRAYLFQFNDDGETMTNTHEWCAEGIPPYIDELVDLPIADFAFLMSFLKRGTYMHVPRVADLPAEAAVEREEFTKEGIQSVLCMPIVNEHDDLIGFIGFDAVRREVNWTTDEINLLAEIAQIFGFLLVRLRNAHELAEAQLEAVRILQTAATPLAIAHAETGLVIYLNDEMARLVGMKKEDIIGQERAVDFYVNPDNETNLIKALEESGEALNQEVELRRADGSTFWGVLSARPYTYQNQPAILISITDISHLRELEQEQREQYAFYQNIINTLPLGLFAKDIRDDNKYVVWNQRLEDMFDIPASKQIGRVDEELYDPQVAAEYAQTDHYLLESEATAVDIPAITVQTEDGERIVHTQKVLIKQDDEPAAIVGIVEDVTARLRTAEELNVRTRAIEASIDPISIADAQLPDMPLIYVNKAFEDITGYTAAEVVGTNCRFLQGDDTDQPAIDEIRAALREQRGCVVELRNYRKNGEMFWNELQISPVFNDDGELTHFIGVQNDITERKESEARLTAALRETESLFAFTSQLNAANNLADILQAVRQPFIGSDMLFASLFTIETNEDNDPEWIQLVERWSKPRAPEQPDDLRFHVPSYPGGSGWVDAPNQPFIIEDTLDLNEVDEVTSQVYQQFNTRSTITLPLKAGERWVGLITFFWDQKQSFDERDRTILATMATQAAVALNNILLLAATRDALTETRIMNQISQALTTADDLNEAIGDLLATLREDNIALNANHIGLTALDTNERGAPERAELIGWWQKDDNPPPIPFNTQIQATSLPLFAAWSIFPLRPVFVEDYTADERLTDSDRQTFEQTNIQAAVLLPLANAGRWVGLLTIGWHDPQTFTDRTKRLYETLMIQTPSAFENRYLFNRTEASLRETATLYEVAQALNSNESLNDGLADTIETLQRNTFFTELASATLYRLETDQAGEPDWSEVVAQWDNTAVPTALDPLGTRYHLPDYPLTRLWLDNPSRLTFIHDINTDDRLTEINRADLAENGTTAVAMMPLLIGGRWVGQLTLNWYTPQTFRSRERRLLRGLASQVATTLDNRLLFDQTNQALRETRTINHINQAINEAQSMAEITSNIRTVLIQDGIANDAQRMVIASLNTNAAGQPTQAIIAGQWRHADTTLPQLDDVLDLAHDPFQPYWGKLPASALLIEDISQDSRLPEQVRQDWPEAELGAAVYLPLTTAGRWIGLIMLNWATPQQFSHQDRALFNAILPQLATGLANQQLFDQAQRRAAQLEIVARVSTVSASILNEQEMLQAVAELAKRSFQVYHTHIYLLNETQDTLFLAAGAGEVGRQMMAENHSIALDNPMSLVARAARTRQSQIVADTAVSDNYLLHPLLPNTRSAMALPMVSGDALLGVLNIQSDIPQNFDEEDVRIQNTLATQIAIALQNIRSFESSEKTRRELSVLARRLTRTGWEDFLREKQTQSDLRFAYDRQRVVPLTADADANINIDNIDVNGGPSNGHGHADQNGYDLLERTLRVQGQPIGRLALDKPQELAEEADDIISAVAANLSAHIENLRLTEQTQQALAQTEMLYRASDSVIRAETIDDILEELVSLTTLREMDRTSLIFFNQPWRTKQPEYGTVVAYWQTEEMEERNVGQIGTRYVLAELPTTRFFSREDAVVFQDVHTDERVDENLRQIMERFGTRSLAVFPLIVSNEWVGVLISQSRQVTRLTEDEARQINNLTDQAATVIENRRLIQQTQEALQETEMLYLLGARLNAAQTQEEILGAVSELPAANTADSLTLLLIDDYQVEPETAILTAGWLPTMNQAIAPDQLGFRTDLREVPLSRLWIENPDQTLIIGDLTNDDLVDETSRAFYDNLSIKALVIIPLTSRGRVFGLLTFSWFAPQDFTEQNERLFRAINGQISTAANNQLLLEQTRVRAELLERLATIETELSQVSSDEEIVHILATNIPDFTGSVSLQYIETNERNEPQTQTPRVVWTKGRIRRDDPRLYKPVPLDLLPTSRLWIENPRHVLYVEDGANDERLGEVGQEMYRKLGLGSVALLPLRSGGVWQGTVVFSKTEAYTFTEEQKFIFSRLLESLAAIVASLRALEAQRAALAESEALYDASVRFNRAETIHDVLQVIATAVSDAGAFSSALWLLETDDDDIPIRGTLTAVWRSDGGEPSVPLGTVLELDDLPGADYWRYSPQDIMLVSDPKTDPRTKDDQAYQAVLDMGGYVATAALPLTIGSRWVGVCTVQWKTVFHFDDADLRLYTTLAAQSAVTIDGLLLLQQTQERAEQLDLQARIEAQLSRAEDESDILHALVDNLPDAPATSLSYIETDEEGNPQHLRSLATYIDGEVAPFDQSNPPIDLRQVPFTELWLNNPQNAILVEDLDHDDRVDEMTRARLSGFKSFAFMPLYSGGRWQGGITFLWPEQHTFTPAERFVFQQILESISAVVASRRSQLEQAAAEAALREVTTLQQGILNSANYSIISTNPEGVIVTVNAAAERLLGYEADELIDKARPTILHDFNEIEARTAGLRQELGQDIEPGFETFVAKARAGGVDEHEWTYLRKDGSFFPVSLSVTSLRNDRNELVGFLFVGSDITERKRAEAAALAAQEETEQLYLASREINEAAGNLTDLISTLGTIHDEPFERSLVLFFDHDQAGLFRAANVVAAWSSGRGPAPTPVGTRYTIDKFPSIHLFQTDTPIFYEDTRRVEALDENSRQLLANIGVLTMGVLPLWISGRQVGVILLEGHEPYNMDDAFKRPYLSLLPQITVAVENRLLLDQAQARARREQVLREITEKVRSSTDINTIMRTAAAEIGRALGRKTVVSLGAPASATEDKDAPRKNR